MSKMSQLAMELDEQAAELGYASYDEALADGYEISRGELTVDTPEFNHEWAKWELEKAEKERNGQ